MIHSSMGGLHMVAALAAILLGVTVILLPKGRAQHRLLGLAYSFAMLMTCVSALLLYGMTGHFGLFHLFAVLCLVYVVMGILQAVLRRGEWMRRHLTWMGWSYIGLLAAAATEASVRLPAFNHLSSGRTFALGGGIAGIFVVVGLAMMPRWKEKMLAAYGQSR